MAGEDRFAASAESNGKCASATMLLAATAKADDIRLRAWLAKVYIAAYDQRSR